MKIVVQRGDLVNKEDIDEMLHKLPSNVGHLVDRIVVHASHDTEVMFNFHEKEKTFEIDSPVSYSGTKKSFLEEVAIHLLIIVDVGYIPRKITDQTRIEYSDKWYFLNREDT